MSSVRSPSNPIIRPSTHSDCMALAQVMRLEDIAEIAAGTDMTPYEALKVGLDSSDGCYTAIWEGRVVMMFGVVPDRGRHSVWLLASDDMLRFSFHFMKECRRWVSVFLENYGSLYGAVWEENQVHVKFLRWLGASFYQDPIYLKGTSKFLVFSFNGAE